MSKKEIFLNKITGNVLNCWSKYKILPSVIVAQAILESSWGESQLAQKANNLFGIKANSTWSGDKYLVTTSEYVNGKKIYIDAYFRKYKSWDESITNHSLFLNKTRYQKIIGNTDYKDVCKLLQSCGYATDINYANKLIGVIESNNLTRFDKGINSNNNIADKDVSNLEFSSGTLKKELETKFKDKKYHAELDAKAVKILKHKSKLKSNGFLESGDFLAISLLLALTLDNK